MLSAHLHFDRWPQLDGLLGREWRAALELLKESQLQTLEAKPFKPHVMDCLQARSLHL